MTLKTSTIFKFMVAGSIVIFTACGGGEGAETHDPVSHAGDAATETPAETTQEEAAATEEYAMGIGPVTERMELGAIDDALATTGEEVFTAKCTACHKMDARVVGPQLSEVTKRRNPEWIMNMILNPDEMTKKDPIAYDLIAEYIAPMANQSLTHDEARSILEYFRKYDGI